MAITTTNLVSFYDLDEASGDRVDSHASNDLSSINSVGQSGGFADFDGSNQRLEITDASQSGLDISPVIFISAFVNIDQLPSVGGRMGLVTKSLSTGNQRSWALVLESSDKLRLYIYKSGDTSAYHVAESTSAAIVSGDVGNYVHFMASYDGSGNSVLYKNNSSIGNTPITGGTTNAIYNSSAAFHLGSYNGASFLNGQMKYTGVWSAIPSSSDRDELYNSGDGASYATLTSGGGPTATNSGFFALM